MHEPSTDLCSARVTSSGWRFATLLLAAILVVGLAGYALAEAANSESLTVYQAVERAFLQLSPSINVSQYGLTSDQVFAVVQQVIDDNPRIIYYDYSQSSLYSDGRLLFRYTQPAAEIRRMWAAYDQTVAAILAEVIEPGQSQLQQLIAVHDYLVAHTSYDVGDQGELSHSAYGALLYQTGVCEAYARALQGLLRELGIESRFITGTASGGDHGWNLVKLDGQYYHVDATWDDPVPDRPGRVLHSYLLLPDSVMRRDHAWVAADYPVCDSDRFAYLFGQDEAISLSEAIYFLNDQEQLQCVNIDGTNRRTLTNQRAAFLASDGEWLYYCNLDDGGFLYRIRPDGSGRSRLNAQASRSISVRDGWLFYRSWDDQTAWRMRTDGSQRSPVNEEINLGQRALILNAGEQPVPLTWSASPAATLRWSSSDQRVATVVDGQVTPISPGLTWVRATTGQGVSAECQVVVLGAISAKKRITLTIGRTEALVDATPLTIPTAPYVKAATGRTMVPLRFVSEALGTEVQWVESTRQVIITRGENRILLTIGSAQAISNGQLKALDCPAELSGSTTCVPLRFVSENLGAVVDYDAGSRQITITQSAG